MKQKKPKIYQKPAITSSTIKNIQFYTRSNYPNSQDHEYTLLAATLIPV